jgi:hypothetical protein
MQKRLGPSPHLPDPLIRVLPVVSQPLKQTQEVLPQIIGDGIVVVIDVDRVHRLTIVFLCTGLLFVLCCIICFALYGSYSKKEERS